MLSPEKKKLSTLRTFEDVRPDDLLTGLRRDEPEPEDRNGNWEIGEIAAYVLSFVGQVPPPEGGVTREEGIETHPADTTILIGQLVARSATGIYPYSAANLSHRHALLGVALGSAAAGGNVRVQTEDTITIPGWGLTSGATYKAGVNGMLATATAGLLFSQIIGRALSSDSLLFSPQPIIKLT